MTDIRWSAAMARRGKQFCVLGIMMLATFSPARPAPAAEGALSEAQMKCLSGALGADPKLSYGQIVKLALAPRSRCGDIGSMRCEEAVAFLCRAVENEPQAVEDIVAGALAENGCDPGAVTCRALQAGAPREAVIRASARAAERGLTAAQKESLLAALAVEPKLSYAEIFKRAFAEGLPCAEVAAFLIGKSRENPRAVEKIVHAALTEGGCDVGRLVCQALQANAPLEPVIRGALRARIDQKEIAAAASCGCFYTPEEIARAFAHILAAGTGLGDWGGGAGSPHTP